MPDPIESLEAGLPKLPRALLPVLVAALLIVSGIWGWSCLGHHRQDAHLQKAAQEQAAALAAASQGEQRDQEAKARQPKIDQETAQATTDDATVAQRRAEVARVRAALLVAPFAPAAPGAPKPQPAGPPVDLAPLVAAQDGLIRAEDSRDADKDHLIADLRAQVDTRTQEAQAYKLAFDRSQAEVVQLRAALALRPARGPWAAGILYGTNRTAGAWGEGDLGPIRVGVDIVRRQIAGGQTTLEAVARAGVRF